VIVMARGHPPKLGLFVISRIPAPVGGAEGTLDFGGRSRRAYRVIRRFPVAKSKGEWRHSGRLLLGWHSHHSEVSGRICLAQYWHRLVTDLSVVPADSGLIPETPLLVLPAA
jgi:hypothetical protein